MSLRRRNKYNARKIEACIQCGFQPTGNGAKVVCGCEISVVHDFDSKAEHRRFQELLLLKKADQIRALEIQPVIYLHAKNKSDEVTCIGKYKADFRYYEKRVMINFWDVIYEDVKGVDTALSKWKRKHVKAEHGIEVRIIK